MSYFSRIAGQSGPRFSGDAGGTPGLRKGRAPETLAAPAPLDREETVFVPSTGSAAERVDAAPPTPERKTEDKARVMAPPPDQVMPRENRSALWEEKPPVHTESTVPPDTEFAKGSDTQQAAEPVRELKKEEEAAVLEVEISHEKFVEERSAKPVKETGEPEDQKRMTDTIRIDEQIMFTETNVSESVAPSGSQGTTPSTGAAPFTGAEIETVTVDPPAKADEKKFFVKTAETIERGNLSTAEIQDIVFQEVVEWAAASPAEVAPDGPDGSEAEVSRGNAIKTIIADREYTRPEQDAESARSEPGVIKVVERKAPEKAGIEELIEERVAGERSKEAGQIAVSEHSPGNLRMEEQSFDLSIGTISVVIENDVRPPERAQQNSRTETRGPETGRGSSRLSRSYL